MDENLYDETLENEGGLNTNNADANNTECEQGSSCDAEENSGKETASKVRAKIWMDEDAAARGFTDVWHLELTTDVKASRQNILQAIVEEFDRVASSSDPKLMQAYKGWLARTFNIATQIFDNEDAMLKELSVAAANLEDLVGKEPKIEEFKFGEDHEVEPEAAFNLDNV
jgi:hypothetical protein